MARCSTAGDGEGTTGPPQVESDLADGGGPKNVRPHNSEGAEAIENSPRLILRACVAFAMLLPRN